MKILIIYTIYKSQKLIHFIFKFSNFSVKVITFSDIKIKNFTKNGIDLLISFWKADMYMLDQNILRKTCR